MLAYALAFKPCSEVTDIGLFYLGVLFFGEI